MSIDPKRAIVDLVGVALQSMRAARDIANASGTEHHELYAKLSLTTGMVAGLVMEVARTTESSDAVQPDTLSPFEAEIMQVVHVHGKIAKSPVGTMAAYALSSLVKRRLLVPANPEGSEFIVPRYLPIGENGALVMVSRGTAVMYDTIMRGENYDVTRNPHVRDSVVKQCWRLVDAGIAVWLGEGEHVIAKNPDVPFKP